jgi:hypothetical protein
VDLSRNNAAVQPFIECEDRLERSAWRRDFWFKSFQSIDDVASRSREWEGALQELESWNRSTDAIRDAGATAHSFQGGVQKSFSRARLVKNASLHESTT